MRTRLCMMGGSVFRKRDVDFLTGVERGVMRRTKNIRCIPIRISIRLPQRHAFSFITPQILSSSLSSSLSPYLHLFIHVSIYSSIHPFIHSFIPAISIAPLQVLCYSEALHAHPSIHPSV